MPCLLCFLALLAAPAPARAAGSVWTELPSPTVTLLNAVKFVNRAEGWAVGDRGAIVRYAKGLWGNFPSGTDEDLLSVAVLGTGEAWAVGRNGTIVRYDGAKWEVHPQSGTLTLLPLNCVKFLSPSIGWAVGGRPCQPGVALRYNGTAWVSATTTQDPLYGLEVLADDNVWMCGGNRRLMHFDGAGFVRYACTPADGGDWNAIAFPYRSIGWVVGDGGLVWRYSSGSNCFSADSASSAITTNTLRGLSMLPGGAAGMAVGDGGVRLRFNGAGFELDAAGGEDLRGIDLTNELEGQAVGGNKAAPTRIVWGNAPGTCPSGYPNSTCNQTGPLGDFTDTFAGPAPVYFRVVARIGGADYCSKEYRIAAEPGGLDPWDTGDDVYTGASELIPTESDQLHGEHFLNAADVADWYRIEMTAGCTYLLTSVYTAGVAVVNDNGDVKGELYASDGSTVVASNDNGAVNLQFEISYAPTVTGTYYLKVFTAAALKQWQGNVRYRQSGCGRENIVVTTWPPSMAWGGSVVVAWNLAGWPSSARITSFRAATTEVALDGLRLYPNPFDPGRGEKLYIDKLPADVDRIEIYTVRGERVGLMERPAGGAAKSAGITYDPVTGVATWAGRIGAGRAAATGSYILRLHTLSGKTGKGIILVVKK